MSDALMFIDFVNSDWFDGSGNADDRLGEPGWLAAFARTWLSGSSAAIPSRTDDYFQPRRLAHETSAENSHLESRDLDLLRELRAVLREVIDTIGTGALLSRALLDRLNRFLESGSIRYRLSGRRNAVSLDVLADPNDAGAIASAVALSAAEFLADGEVARLKQCDNHGCRWVFYDTTRNNSRRWCDPSLCGNVDKVRRYRQRHTPDQ